MLKKRIGLNVGSGNILIPRKSVTAVAGLSQTPVPKKTQGMRMLQYGRGVSVQKKR